MAFEYGGSRTVELLELGVGAVEVLEVSSFLYEKNGPVGVFGQAADHHGSTRTRVDYNLIVLLRQASASPATGGGCTFLPWQIIPSLGKGRSGEETEGALSLGNPSLPDFLVGVDPSLGGV